MGDGFSHLFQVIGAGGIRIKPHPARRPFVGSKLASGGQQFARNFILERRPQEANNLVVRHSARGCLDGLHVFLEAELLADDLEGSEDRGPRHGLPGALSFAAPVAVFLTKGLQSHPGQRNRLTLQLGASNQQWQLLGDGIDGSLEIALKERAALADGVFLAARPVSTAFQPCGVLVSTQRVGDGLIETRDSLNRSCSGLCNTTHQRIIQPVARAVAVEQFFGVEIEFGFLHGSAQCSNLLPRHHAMCGTFGGGALGKARIFPLGNQRGTAGFDPWINGLHGLAIRQRLVLLLKHASTFAGQHSCPAFLCLHGLALRWGGGIPRRIERGTHFWLYRDTAGRRQLLNRCSGLAIHYGLCRCDGIDNGTANVLGNTQCLVQNTGFASFRGHEPLPLGLQISACGSGMGRNQFIEILGLECLLFRVRQFLESGASLDVAPLRLLR